MNTESSFIGKFCCFECLWPRRSPNQHTSNNPDLYVDMEHLQRKPRAVVSRETLLRQLPKLVERIVSLLEVSIVMHMLLAFLLFNPPTILFWYYLGNSRDHSSAISSGTVDNKLQSNLNTAMAFITLAVLIWAYVTSCWTTTYKIKRFSWIFSGINAIVALMLGLEASHPIWLFSRAVLVGLRGLILGFNLLTLAKCFKIGRVYKLLKIEGGSVQPDIELQTFENRLGQLMDEPHNP